MQEYPDKFVDELKKVLGENLISVILYGSAAKGEDIPEQSDINLIAILKEFSLLKIDSVEKIVLKAERKKNVKTVFWTEEELKNSVDVFPVEFLDIKENHRVLFGKDIFSGISVDTKNIRHQIEFELRSKMLRLRGEWLNLKGSKPLLYDFLISAGTSFLYIFECAEKIAAGKLNESLAEPFKKCIQLKKKEIKLGRMELGKLYSEVHDAVCRIISVIDGV